MTARTNGSHRRDQQGFALLALLALVGIGSVGLIFAVERFLPPLAGVPMRTENNLAVAERAARLAFRRNGAFPTDLTGLIAAADLDPNGAWRVDPWASPIDLNYRRQTTAANVRSRGRDARLGTADDVQATVPAESLVRARQRGRLRMLRAVLLRSPYSQAATMDETTRDTMRVAMRDQAIARRSWLTADAGTRTVLQATLTATAATIASLRSIHACPPIPNRVVGAGGLMGQLGIPDTRAYDGLGRRLIRDVVLGTMSAGYDRRRGTNDDM